MMQFRKGAVIALVTTSMAAGAIGAWVLAPGAGGAATTSTTTPNANGGSGGTFHSNEDPAHEKAESPQREAEENSGQFRPWGGGGSNEDPQHEAQESPEREAQENARNGGSGATGGSGSTGSTVNPNG